MSIHSVVTGVIFGVTECKKVKIVPMAYHAPRGGAIFDISGSVFLPIVTQFCRKLCLSGFNINGYVVPADRAK